MTFAPFGDDDLPPVITDEERHDVTARARKALETLNCDRDDVLLKIERYVHGNHPGPYIPNSANKEYRVLADRSTTNLTTLVINTPAQALYVEGHRLEGTADPSPAWTCWQRNRMDGRQSQVYRAALAYGQAFVAVEKDMRGKARALLLSPLYTTALYEDPVNDQRPSVVLNVRRFDPDTADGQTGYARMWDSEFYYEMNLIYGGDIEIVSRTPHGFSDTPVVPFAPYRDLEGRPYGLLWQLLGVQDRLNQTVFDLLLAQTWTSHSVRYATGLVPPPKVEYFDVTVQEAIDSGKIESGDPRISGKQPTDVIGQRSEFVRDPDGNPVPQDITIKPGALLTIKDPAANVGQLPAGDLSGLIASIGECYHDLSAISQIPYHYLIGNLANLSADALAVAESSLWLMIAEFQHSFGESWEQVFQLFAEAEGLEGADDFNSEVRWRDTRSRSISQVVDSITKGVQMAGIPLRAAWEMWPGVTDGDLARWQELHDEALANYQGDPEAALIRSVSPANMQILDQMGKGGGAGGGAV